MKTTWFAFLLVVGGLGGNFAAQGQTARIAYLSHGGNLDAAGTLADLDNFGTPPARFSVDTLVAISDTTAEARGKLTVWGDDGARSKRTIYYGKHYYRASATPGGPSRAAAVKQLQQRYPGAKLVGFDTAAVAAPVPAPATEIKKAKTKHKRRKEALLHSVPLSPPRHPGVWLALATIIGLGAAGLLLGDKPRPVPGKVA